MALPSIPLFERALEHARQVKHPAVVDDRWKREVSYTRLVCDVARFREQLLGKSEGDLKEARVAFLFPSGYSYVVTLCGIWGAGGIAVPICTTHPLPEMIYTVTDSQASILVAHESFAERIEQVGKALNLDASSIIIMSDSDFVESSDSKPSALPTLFPFPLDRRALIIYTSGTTGRPKGVVSLHSTLTAQIESMINPWRWSSRDRILHVLPLHHVHGIVNALLCCLWTGATCEMWTKFDADKVWKRWIAGAEGSLPPVTVFMAVPTIYSKLNAHYRTFDQETAKKATQSCSQFRLMVSGSAALPAPLRRDWERISGGVVLLERFGMSEIGMGLSCGYDLEARGSVGLPLPGVQIRLMAKEAQDGNDLERDVTDQMEIPGEIQVKGPILFAEYWNKPDATAKEFTADGWFKTGDIAVRKPPHGYYFILGRNSVDIIKSGGYKISALEVEREILALPGVEDVAVVAVPDEEWGERVAAIIVPREDDGEPWTLSSLRKALKAQMAAYKIPSLLKLCPQGLPKNAMGKVTKKGLWGSLPPN